MKKYVVLFAAAALLTACGQTNSVEVSSSSQETTTQTTKKVQNSQVTLKRVEAENVYSDVVIESENDIVQKVTITGHMNLGVQLTDANQKQEFLERMKEATPTFLDIDENTKGIAVNYDLSDDGDFTMEMVITISDVDFSAFGDNEAENAFLDLFGRNIPQKEMIESFESQGYTLVSDVEL